MGLINKIKTLSFNLYSLILPNPSNLWNQEVGITRMAPTPLKGGGLILLWLEGWPFFYIQLHYFWKTILVNFGPILKGLFLIRVTTTILGGLTNSSLFKRLC